MFSDRVGLLYSCHLNDLHFADVEKVGKARFFRAKPDNLWRLHHEALLLAGHELGVVGAHNGKHTVKHLVKEEEWERVEAELGIPHAQASSHPLELLIR